MTKIRRVFPPEFKQEAVRRVTEGGRSIAEVSRDVGVRPEQLRTWKKQFLALGLVTRSAQGESVEEELRRVKRELDVMRQERDFAKKAAVGSISGRNIFYPPLALGDVVYGTVGKTRPLTGTEARAVAALAIG